jgi:enoyl-CoA hydratase/carnithine racemase
MGLNFSRLGLSPGMGGSWVITQLAGYPVAADLIYSGRTISAAEAYRLGLVNEVHSLDQATAAVQQLAETIANNAPIAVREAKKVIQANITLPLDDALKNEAKGQAVSFQTEDLAEGIQAIREKREPRFKGK